MNRRAPQMYEGPHRESYGCPAMVLDDARAGKLNETAKLRENGGRTWARTKDPLIKSQLLYQLSYASIPGLAAGPANRGEAPI